MEHINVYHTLTDWLMIFQTIQLHKLDINNIQLFVLDNHIQGPLDSFLTTVFSPNNALVRWKDLKKEKTLFSDVIWVPAGYANIMMINWKEEISQCNSKIQIFHDFR